MGPARSLSEHPLRLLDGAGHRLGIVGPAQPVAPTPADLPGIHNWSVPLGPADPRRSLGGGVGWTAEVAEAAAVGEALERYAGAQCRLEIQRRRRLGRRSAVIGLDALTLVSPAQQRRPGFPHGPTYRRDAFTRAQQLGSGEPAWLPAAVVSLHPGHGSVATSNGLAAGPDVATATLRAAQELVERDAFMATWLHQVGGRRIRMPAAFTAAARQRGGWVLAFDATPAYSPHPVAIVAGSIPLGGRPRNSLGLACRSSWAAALDKAYLEWAQGITFVGHRQAGAAITASDDVRSFDDHALHHSLRPDGWSDLAIFAGPDAEASADAAIIGGASEELDDLVSMLGAADVDLYAVELTTVDLHQLGVRVVRAVAPALTPIHGDHRWPHLGGTTGDLARRYPGAPVRGPFPSPHPHPLG